MCGAWQCYLKVSTKNLGKSMRQFFIHSNFFFHSDLKLKFCLALRNAICKSYAKKEDNNWLNFDLIQLFLRKRP